MNREHLIQALKNMLSSLELTQPSLYNRIRNTCIVLFKYTDLMDVRLNRYQKIQENIESLELLIEFDGKIKEKIFKSKININKCFEILDVVPLSLMLSYKDHPNDLLLNLNQSLRNLTKASREWQTNIKLKLDKLKQNRNLYYRHQIKKMGKFAYRHSLAGLFGELVPWLGNTVVEKLTDKSLESQSKYLFNLLKATGIGVGLFYTYTGGLYSFGKQLSVIAFSMKISKKIKHPSITLSNTQRASSFLISTAESTYFQDLRPLLFSLGGLSGSIGTTALVTRVFPELKPESLEERTEDQTFMLFLISLLGYELGQWFTEMSINTAIMAWTNIQNKENLRNRFSDFLKTVDGKGIFKESEVEFPNIHTRPLLWFNQHSPLKLTWRDSKGLFYQSNCNLQEMPANEVLLNCDKPIITQRLGV